MKKITFRLTILISLILFLVTPAFAYSEENPLVVDLIAGQNKNAGSVKVWDDGESLFVMYETMDPWCLTETHLAVASSLDGIPQANGNPIPGQFPYKNSHKCATGFLYKIPLEKNVCDLYIAAHAVVKRPGSTETAWGNGTGFPGKNWATYFTYEVTSCNETPPTSTFTPSNTPTQTPSFTPTGTPSNTPTQTPSFTPTGTLSNTPTQTPSSTPTPTYTPTATGPACQPTVVVADFSKVANGTSVEGMGTVAPGLNIDAIGTAIRIRPGVQPSSFISPNNDPTTLNAGIDPNGGFTDFDTRNAVQAHLYTFTFAPGVIVSNFSIQMKDFGDYNPTLATNHYASITAYDAQDAQVAIQELSYTTPPDKLPTSSDIYGNLNITGDSTGASPGQPGNWTWTVSGTGIVRIVLSFGEGYDPNIGFTILSFTTTNCTTVTPPPACQPAVVAADFSKVANGTSVEGMGAVAPGLNIDAIGTAIRIQPGVQPSSFISPNNDPTTLNAGIDPNGGFTDFETRNAVQAHLYTFTFSPGLTVSNFSIQMKDFGDYNPTLATNHYASITAYDAQDAQVAIQELGYTTPPEKLPSSSDLYGNLIITGDATGASPGQPGNWTWTVSGTGIVRIVLASGEGFDPNIGFTVLSFTTECPTETQLTLLKLGSRHMNGQQHGGRTGP